MDSKEFRQRKLLLKNTKSHSRLLFDDEMGTYKVSDADLRAIGKLTSTERRNAIKQIRLGEPWKETPKKRTPRTKEVSPAKLVDNLRSKHVSPLVRGIDAVAKVNGGKGECHTTANDSLNTLEKTLKQMRGGKQ